MPSIIKTKKNRENKYGKKITYLLCGLKGFVLFIVGALILSLLLLKSQNNNITLYIFLYMIIALGGFISGFSSYRRLKERGFLNGIIGSAVYCALVMLVIIIFMKFNVALNLLLVVPITILSGFLGGTIGANT